MGCQYLISGSWFSSMLRLVGVRLSQMSGGRKVWLPVIGITGTWTVILNLR